MLAQIKLALPQWHEYIERSYLSINLKIRYAALLNERSIKLKLTS